MKKRNLKKLTVNKKAISSLTHTQIKGGNFTENNRCTLECIRPETNVLDTCIQCNTNYTVCIC
ncbi:class I lanthipeptide [Kordia sp.]|uniref:class I lanthipeptide n=1 Tax=Kordia sp. TaxID=1965332 RepID=UPI003D2E5A95